MAGWKSNITEVLRGSFLGNERITRLLPYAIFLTVLALAAIYSGHSADRKVHKINTLRNEVNELESEYLDTKARLMQLELESKVAERIESAGLRAPEQPPVQLKAVDHD